MKKILSLLLAVVMILSLCSCQKPTYADYSYKYLDFLYDKIIPETGIRSSDISDVDMRSMNPDGYTPQSGLIFADFVDLDGDNLPELATGEETECDDFFGDENSKNTAIKIKVYGISKGKVEFIDETEIKQLLPLFSFVDITSTNGALFVSGIDAWAGDPPFNDHYVIKLVDGKLVQEKLSTMDMFITIPPEELSSEEKDVVYGTLKKLQDYGFGYKNIYDITGRTNSAELLATYSLFGKDGRSSEYFDGRKVPEKGFRDYTQYINETKPHIIFD
ncbi:MAG: hypothetical protein IKB55_03485 [Clostridia bacterium]|nr:hypothetical protein [Clostridia bacterium]